MLRMFKRIDADDRITDLWIDDRYVVEVGESGPSHCWIGLAHVQGPIRLQGNARDVALTLNGHYDE